MRPLLMRTGLDTSTLRLLWALADIDKDGKLDIDEFAVAMYLADCAKGGMQLPDVLPSEMVPPNKRSVLQSKFL